MRIIILVLLCVPLLAQQPPPPTAEEQAAIIADVRQKALAYSNNLADFLCTQITRRSVASAGNATPEWKLEDTLTIRLAYVNQREQYRVIRINDKTVDKSLDKVGGHQTRGEFGSILRDISAPQSQTEFHWERWSVVEGTPAAVLSYQIRYATSPFQTTTTRGALVKLSHTYKWGAKGELEIDRETRQVLRLVVHAEDVPRECPVKEVEVAVVYGYARIGDAQFLLPLRSNSTVGSGTRLVKAETEFTNYRKFTTETGIKFEPLDAR
jgi:hypothetical protein